MDMVADKTMAVSVKNLVGWPILALIAVVISSYQPKVEVAQAQTATATSTVPPIVFPSPTPQQHPTNAPTGVPGTVNVVPTTVPPPVVKNPVSAVPPGPPGMVYDPAHNVYRYPAPAESFSIPAAPHH
jgi:hypothetical protein